MSYIVEYYKDTIVGRLGKKGTSDLLLHIVQYWREFAVDKENRYIPMVMYC